MAILIDIKKVAEDDSRADYMFTVDGAISAGVLRIDKKSNHVSLLRPLKGIAASDAHFQRSAYKIQQHWGKGNFPETATWAS